MNKEEKLLLSVCRCYFNDDKPEVPEGVDWKGFYTLAENHNSAGICHCVINKNKALFPKEIQKLFLEKFYDLVYLYEKQTQALNDIKACFENSKVPYILFKGAVIRDIYPVKESRAMGDIDLLVKNEDRDSARSALEKIGFNCYAPNGAVREYSRENVILEVHTKLIGDMDEKAFDDAFENARFDGCEGRLNDSYHMSYLIAHIAHHFRFYGAGIKLILDLAFMLKQCEIDLDFVLRLLSSLELDTFAKEILSVTYHMFSVGIEYKKNTGKTEEYLLKCGAFGSLNKNKGATIARRNLQDGKSASPFSVKLRLAFPSYSQMKNIPYIKFIEGRPWLTPYAWCYRFIYNMKNRKAFTKNTLRDINKKSSVTADEEFKFFEEIGLWHS